MTLTSDELTELLDRPLAGWENEVVEFKEAAHQYSADKTGEYVSALSNEANQRGLASGWLVFAPAVSAVIAGATGRLADYVRTRPQTDAHYAPLVIDFLRRNGGASRADIDALLAPLLPEVLTPQQQRNKVANLLSKLRAEGTISDVGTRSRPRWELS